ncbi:MAG TPA: flavin reductase family protein [Thermoplasmata archaeon]|nr:flavin reductase family protein [Thermoplasmata archaeon]
MTLSPPTVPPARFRALMSRWATGVAVVTASGPGGDAGLTVNALTSIALDPPSLLVSLTRDADTLPVIEQSGRFAASFLSVEQRALSERFARTIPPREKFRDVPLRRAPGGSPLIDGSLGALECRVERRVPLFDHVLLIGIVEHAEAGADALPLLFFRSDYGAAVDAERLRLPPPRP